MLYEIELIKKGECCLFSSVFQASSLRGFTQSYISRLVQLMQFLQNPLDLEHYLQNIDDNLRKRGLEKNVFIR